MTASVSQYSRSGFTEAGRYVGTYRSGSRSKVINGYPYGASTAPPMTTEEQAERDEKLEAQMLTVRENWDKKWLPELESDLAAMRSAKLDELKSDALWDAVEKALELHTRHWFIHHRVVLPVIEQSNKLGKICEEILDSKDESVTSVLLHGAETMTVRSIKELEKLARFARESTEVRAAIEKGTGSEQVTAALEESEPGREWLESMRSYLEQFGYRCTGFDLSFPTWIEDQTLLFQIVRSLLKTSNSDAKNSQEQKLDAERDALLGKIREAGKDRPELLERFEKEYALGQQIWPLKEDHSHYIDQASTALVRITLAEVGRRLEANGAIDQADDVWYINLEEAKQCLVGNPAADIKQLVADRRSDRERFSKITPPKYLGTMPADHEAIDSATGETQSAVESGGTLRGTAASKGETSGVARVVLSPDDFHKVQDGDVLVCRSTAPMWTPLFKVISGLVSEAGGVLSHPAVVAREFNLPAVVGVQKATDLIEDGQLVTVSGTDGLVHIA